ncbi:Holliday junction resolvase RecU [Bacillus thuringiensis]|uniref:Holliday junction resolvase RecU n=1 Tax=Bacillus thuringiensis TaxID=1428 RepID=UPI003A853C85
MGLGNRGMVFEMLINLANEMYQRGGVALINKRPTPVKVLKSKGGRVLNGFYEAKSTVDYDGVYKGRAIAFEAKSTEKDTRFENKLELKHEGISLFPEIRDTRHISNIKFKQIDKALQYVLDYDEAEIIKRKYLNTDKPKDSFIYSELSMKKDHFYYNKKNAIRLITTSLGMI